jgi:photosystem II stability/assembly factor-like uncharacterized protein
LSFSGTAGVCRKRGKELVMGKAGVYFVAVTSLILVFTASAAANEKEPDRQWIRVSNAVMDANIKDVAVSKEDPDLVYIISDQAVYMTVNSGKSWSELLSFGATDNRLNTITLSKDANTVYVGTKDGLYMEMDRGAKWERIFRGIGELENAVYAVSVNALNNEIIIIGTMDGIYHTKDRGTNWSKGKNIPAHTIVTSIAADSSHQEILYACSSNGVYKSLDSGLRWSRVYELITPEEDYQYLFEDEDEDISQIIEVIKTRDILVGPAEYSNVYLATSNGLIISSDNGMSWINTGSTGLLTRNIKSITIAGNDMLYAATDRGVFRYVKDADRWQALTRGLSTFDIRSLDSGTSWK